MRCSALVLATLLLGCRMSELDAPIGIVMRDLSDQDAENLVESARCWNLELGTQFVVGPDEQQVEAFYDKFTCSHGAAAQVQAGWPMRIAICPQEYWVTDQEPFRVLSHELGHVANIIGHPDNSLAVMRSGGYPFTPMFTEVDRQMFADANPGFAGVDRCDGVVRRAVRPGTNATIGHCVCDREEPLDLDQSISIVLGGYPETYVSRFQAALDCTNLRYGTQLVLDDSASTPQRAYVRPPGTDSCDGARKRLQEHGTVYVCSPASNGSTLFPYVAIGEVLGIWLSGNWITDDPELAKLGRAPIGCTDIVRDEVTGVCMCQQ